MYSLSHLERHFRKLFRKLEAKARRSILIDSLQQRPPTFRFELSKEISKEISKMSIQMG